MGKYGKVESVTLVEHISEDLDLCEVIIDFDAYKMFGAYNKILAYTGRSVEYDVMPDIWRGLPITRIANVYERNIIQTVDKTENIQLIPLEASTREVCTFDSTALRPGDSDRNCIALLSDFQMGSSMKAKWADCLMVDMNARAFNMRIFTSNLVDKSIDAEVVLNDLKGHYVKFNPTNYAKFGIQTDMVELVNIDVAIAPEVEVAITQIQNAVADDEALQAYMQKYDYIETLKHVMYGELGYHLVAIASEIYLINAVNDIAASYDKKTMIRAAITSRGYLLPSKTKFSHSILNITKVLSSELSKDRELLLILDVLAEEEESSTKLTYYKLKRMAKDILDDRRGVLGDENEKYRAVSLDSIKHEFSGML